jgi:hypothetical protein
MTVFASALIATAAFAFFTSTGSGTGGAQTANGPNNITISQVGAGYDSLVPGNGYVQDQCLQCASLTQVGNQITLANSGAQQLTSVVVAFRNWGGPIASTPITLRIDDTVAGPISDTENPSFPAAIVPGANPSVTNVTFDFSSQGAFVEQTTTYGITYGDPAATGSLNVALSSSATQLSVGSDTVPGTIWLTSSTGASNDDFPTCVTSLPTTFGPVAVDCGPENGSNPGAYGNDPLGNADIPAVEFNVVGGIASALSPGGPSQPINIAITNPNTGSVHVGSVETTITGTTKVGCTSAYDADVNNPWYQLSPPKGGSNGLVSDLPVNGNVPPGTTLYLSTGTSIAMIESNTNQDACEGAGVNLSFSSN